MTATGGAQRRDRLDPATAAIRNALAGALAREDVRRPLVAVSGGADSMSLSAAMLFLSAREAIPAAFGIVDHGLQAGSAEHTARVADLLRGLGAEDVRVRRVEVGRDGGVEAAARAARYAALEQMRVATGADAVLLAHTLDDQAETVLLNLARGAGPAGLAGMRERRGTLVRPLLGVRRSATLASCQAQGIPMWSDPMNDDPRFARVRVRREVLPVLEAQLGPGYAEALARLAALTAADDDALDGWAQRWRAGWARDAGEDVRSLPVDELSQLPLGVRRRAVRQELGALGMTTRLAHLEAIDELIDRWHGQDAVDLPGGSAARVDGHLVFRAR